MAETRIASMTQMFDAMPAASQYMGRGQNFFVDGAFGNDSNNGETWDTAFKTITVALAACTNWYDDCIFVNNYGNQTGEDYPIDWNKKQVHVFGVSSLAYPMLIQSDLGSEIAVEFPDNDGAASTFYNMAFATGTTPTVAAVKMTGDAWNLHFDHCQFGWMGQPAKYGIQTVGDTPDMLITNCTFDGAGITQHQILIGGSSTRAVIKNCVFHAIPNGYHGITDTGGTGFLFRLIKDNIFNIVTGGEDIGQAIEHTGTGGGGLVTGNIAGDDKADITANPYGESGSNAWCLNYNGKTVTQPA